MIESIFYFAFIMQIEVHFKRKVINIVGDNKGIIQGLEPYIIYLVISKVSIAKKFVLSTGCKGPDRISFYERSLTYALLCLDLSSSK